MASTTRHFARAALRAGTQRTAVAAPRQAFRQGGRRFNSTQPPKTGGSSSLLWLTGAAAAGGAGYYFFTQANGGSSATDFKPSQKDYQEVYNAVAKRIEEHDEYEDGSYGPVVLRLAWHASGTYDTETKTGGSNGATMRFSPEADHGANAGLKVARDFLEPIKSKPSPLPRSSRPAPRTSSPDEHMLTRTQQSSSPGSPTRTSGSSPASPPSRRCRARRSPSAPAARTAT